MTQYDNVAAWAATLLPNPETKPRLNRCGGLMCEKLDYHQALAHVALNIDQFAIFRRAVDGVLGKRISNIEVLHPGDKISFVIAPMLFGQRGPRGTAEVCANARGLLYGHAPGFQVRRWLVSCPALKCWRVWIEELDGPADPLEPEETPDAPRPG